MAARVEDTENSEFIYIKNVSDMELLDDSGSTSLAYKLCIDGRVYFMKQLRPELQYERRYREAFIKEYNTGRGIENPHVVKYLDLKEDNHGLYILMEYINGITIKEKVAKEPEYFSHKKNLHKLLLQLCEGIKALHKDNIVHLDITPNNILIQQVNNDIKLVDLGFCLSNYNDSTPGSTAKYTAPETSFGDTKEIDARTDIYAIGSLLQYIEEKALKGQKLPHLAQKIKRRCLQAEKEKRYQNIDEIVVLLQPGKAKRAINILVAIVAAMVVILGTIELYKAIDNYIAWETGKIAYKFEENGIHYQITDFAARTVEVTYKGNYHAEYECEYGDGTIVIPSKVTHRGRTFRVTAIGMYAFDNPETTSVILPEGLETIKENAFGTCRITGTIYIPKTVKEIDGWNYIGHTSIDGFTVDEENTTYDSRYGCNAIIETATNTIVATCKNTVIPHDVTAIGPYAFASWLEESFVIPDHITALGEGAFYTCRFSTIHIPDGITEIGPYCFFYCTNMQKVKLPEGLTRIDEKAFGVCGLQEAIIPDNVTVIGKEAFTNCKSLQAVTIGSGVKELEAYAFKDCSSLQKVVSRIPADKLTATGSGCFENIGNKCVLYVPRGAKRVYENTLGWNNFAKIVEVDM